MTRAVALVLAILCGLTAAQAQEPVRVGTVRSLGSLATVLAVEKGYFKEAGVNVELVDLDTSGDAMALLAQGRLQVVEGGLSATYFNALQKDLPVIVADSNPTSFSSVSITASVIEVPCKSNRRSPRNPAK